MPTFAYNTGIPNGPNNPSDDQPLMQTNTNSINSIIGVDHYTFGTGASVTNGSDGYHKIIHLPPQSTPATIASILQLFSQNATFASVTDTQLFYKTGAGGVAQLTGASASTSGYLFTNGLIIQWGLKALSGGGTGILTFTNPFPTNCLWVGATLQTTAPSGANPNTISIVNTPSNTQVTYNFSGTTSYQGFYWLAIGN